MRDLASRTFELLRQRLAQTSGRSAAGGARRARPRIALLARFDEIVVEPIDGQRIRCHGDYHLGQVIDTGDDFVIIDFEGEPARPLEERRAKRSPLIDVAGMIRSLHYAASQAMFQRLRSERRGPHGGECAARCGRLLVSLVGRRHSWGLTVPRLDRANSCLDPPRSAIGC